jgi:hypothetical protein
MLGLMLSYRPALLAAGTMRDGRSSEADIVAAAAAVHFVAVQLVVVLGVEDS